MLLLLTCLILVCQSTNTHLSLFFPQCTGGVRKEWEFLKVIKCRCDKTCYKKDKKLTWRRKRKIRRQKRLRLKRLKTKRKWKPKNLKGKKSKKRISSRRARRRLDLLNSSAEKKEKDAIPDWLRKYLDNSELETEEEETAE